MEAYDVERSIAEGRLGLQDLMKFVTENAAGLEAHEAEKGIFRLLMPIGLAALKVYFAKRGTGDVGPAIKRPGEPLLLREKTPRECDYMWVREVLRQFPACLRPHRTSLLRHLCRSWECGESDWERRLAISSLGSPSGCGERNCRIT